MEQSIITGDAIPVRLLLYQIPHALQEEVHEELKEMLDHGVVEE